MSGLYLFDPLSGSMFEVNRDTLWSWQDFKAGYWSSSDPFVMMSSQEWFGHMYFLPNSKVVLEIIPTPSYNFEHILIITEYCLELILPSHFNVPSLLSKYIISILILSIMWNLPSLILLLGFYIKMLELNSIVNWSITMVHYTNIT